MKKFILTMLLVTLTACGAETNNAAEDDGVPEETPPEYDHTCEQVTCYDIGQKDGLTQSEGNVSGRDFVSCKWNCVQTDNGPKYITRTWLKGESYGNGVCYTLTNEFFSDPIGECDQAE